MSYIVFVNNFQKVCPFDGFPSVIVRSALFTLTFIFYHSQQISLVLTESIILIFCNFLTPANGHASLSWSSIWWTRNFKIILMPQNSALIVPSCHEFSRWPIKRIVRQQIIQSVKSWSTKSLLSAATRKCCQHLWTPSSATI